jgi:prepilin-type N-terminal cleavage/methylation domain-containing protein/prepilin-type processing-associated H-X9-DG protein
MNPTPATTPRTAKHRALLVRSSRAFTLIELLTVIAIIGILAALVIPTVGNVRKSANSAKCLSNLRQIGNAFSLYAADNKGRLPRGGLNPRPTDPAIFDALWMTAISSYIQRAGVATHEVYRCPSEPVQADPARINTTNQYGGSRAMERSGSTVLATGLGARMEEIPNPARTFLVVDAWVQQSGVTIGVTPRTVMTYAEITAATSGAPEASTTVSFRHSTGVNCLFVDGHTARLSFVEFKDRVADPIEGRRLWDPFGKF